MEIGVSVVAEQAFRDLMAAVCAPVTVVTAAEDERSENRNQGHPAPPGIGRFRSAK